MPEPNQPKTEAQQMRATLWRWRFRDSAISDLRAIRDGIACICRYLDLLLFPFQPDKATASRQPQVVRP